MKKLALFLFATVSLLGSGSIATAQYYYGGGYYGGPDPYYRYGRGYGYGYGGAIIGRDNFGRQEVWYRVGPGGRCPRGFTVQDGFCKRYRGY
jgi:hypothetical protein